MRKMIFKRNSLVINTILIVIVFFAIFHVPISKLSTTYTISAIMAIIAYILSRGKLIVKYNHLSPIMGFVPFLLYIIFSCLGFAAISSSNMGIYFSNVTQICAFFFFTIVSTYFLYVLAKKVGIEMINNYIIAACIIQLLFVVVCLASGSIKNSLLRIIVNNSNNTATVDAISKYSSRVFGFSGYFFDIFGYIMSVLITLIFALSIKRKSLLIFIIAISLIIIPVVNARTGIVLAAIGMAIIATGTNYNIRSIKISKCIKALAIIVSLFAAILIIRKIPDTLIAWIMSGFDSIIALIFKGERISVFNQILNQDIVFPDNLLFGVGGRPENLGYFAKDGSYIDVGFIQMIWRYGLVGTGLFIFGLIKFYKCIIKKFDDKLDRRLIYAFFMIFIIYCFKTYPLNIHGANFIILSYPYMWYIYKAEKL